MLPNRMCMCVSVISARKGNNIDDKKEDPQDTGEMEKVTLSTVVLYRCTNEKIRTCLQH